MIKILSQLCFDGFEDSILAQHPAAMIRFADKPGQLNDFNPQCLVADPYRSDEAIELLTRFPSIEWVHLFSGDAEGFPIDAIGQCTLTCATGATAVSIGEWTMAAMLSKAKRFPEVFINNRSDWQQSFADNLNASLHGQHLGLIGFGRVGVAIASRASNFGMKVQAYTRREDITIPGVFPATDLDKMIAEVDHLVLAQPLQAEHECLIDAKALANAKPHLHIINVARASMINLDDLKHALDNQQIASATLDALGNKPLEAGHWLYQHPQVRISPNIAWRDLDGLIRMQQLLLVNLRRFVAGDILVKQVINT